MLYANLCQTIFYCNTCTTKYSKSTNLFGELKLQLIILMMLYLLAMGTNDTQAITFFKGKVTKQPVVTWYNNFLEVFSQ